MARTKGANTVSEEICKSTHDISILGVRQKDITVYYKIKPETVSSILRRMHRTPTRTIKKRGVRGKLSARGLRLFHKYVLQYCY